MQSANTSNLQIDPVYFEWENWECVPLRLSGDFSGGVLKRNQRAFFDNSALYKDDRGRIRRLTAIQVMPGLVGEGPGPGVLSTRYIGLNGMKVIPLADLPDYTLTIVDKYGFESHKDIALMDLTNNQNSGKIRVFDVFADMKKCYVKNLVADVTTVNLCILFNFHFANW